MLLAIRLVFICAWSPLTHGAGCEDNGVYWFVFIYVLILICFHFKFVSFSTSYTNFIIILCFERPCAFSFVHRPYQHHKEICDLYVNLNLLFNLLYVFVLDSVWLLITFFCVVVVRPLCHCAI